MKSILCGAIVCIAGAFAWPIFPEAPGAKPKVALEPTRIQVVSPEFRSPAVATQENVEIVATFAGGKLGQDDVIPRGKLVQLNPEGAGESYPLWDIRYPAEFEEFAEENGKLFLAMPNEDVGISLTLIPKDFPDSPPIRIRSVLKVKKDQSEPDEEKDEPKPKPDPKPTAKVGGVVVVEQRSNFSESTRNIRMSETWRKLSTTQEIVNKASWYDIDDPNASMFKSAAESVGLPAVLLFDLNGDFIKAYPLPKTESEFMDLIK